MVLHINKTKIKHRKRKKEFTNNRRPDNGGNSLEEEKKSERVSKFLRTKKVSQHQRGQKNIGGTESFNHKSKAMTCLIDNNTSSPRMSSCR